MRKDSALSNSELTNMVENIVDILTSYEKRLISLEKNVQLLQKVQIDILKYENEKLNEEHQDLLNQKNELEETLDRLRKDKSDE